MLLERALRLLRLIAQVVGGTGGLLQQLLPEVAFGGGGGLAVLRDALRECVVLAAQQLGEGLVAFGASAVLLGEALAEARDLVLHERLQAVEAAPQFGPQRVHLASQAFL